MDKIKEINSKDGKKSRHRGENWTQEEKDLLLEIMRKSAHIIENKKTDTNTNKQKNLEWVKVQKRLRGLTGKYRDIAQLKGFWKRIKTTAKKNVSQHKRAVKVTGGGHCPPSPSEDDQKVVELCPTDFVIELNQLNSDGMFENEKNNEPTNIKLKTRSIEMMEEEHALKTKYRELELSHQEVKQKLEIDILLLEKERKQLEIKILKKSLE